MEVRISPSGEKFVVRRKSNYVFNIECEDSGWYMTDKEFEQFIEETEECTR